jgi:hypothetical protein
MIPVFSDAMVATSLIDDGYSTYSCSGWLFVSPGSMANSTKHKKRHAIVR